MTFILPYIITDLKGGLSKIHHSEQREEMTPVHIKSCLSLKATTIFTSFIAYQILDWNRALSI